MYVLQSTKSKSCVRTPLLHCGPIHPVDWDIGFSISDHKTLDEGVVPTSVESYEVTDPVVELRRGPERETRTRQING